MCMHAWSCQAISRCMFYTTQHSINRLTSRHDPKWDVRRRFAAPSRRPSRTCFAFRRVSWRLCAASVLIAVNAPTLFAPPTCPVLCVLHVLTVLPESWFQAFPVHVFIPVVHKQALKCEEMHVIIWLLVHATLMQILILMQIFYRLHYFYRGSYKFYVKHVKIYRSIISFMLACRRLLTSECVHVEKVVAC